MRDHAEVQKLNRLDHALALAARGFKVFPLKPGAKAPPLLNGWPQKATSDPAEVRTLWLAVPDANIGIHCEGLLVVDVDVAKGGKDALELLRLAEGLPDTLRTLTPSGGEHHFFRLPAGHPGVANTVGALGAGLDLRSTGGYVVAPGSVVAAGTYAAAGPAEIADAPLWLLERCGRRDPAATPEPAAVLADAPDEVLEAARAWLRTQAPAVEGQGGDAHTFEVICGLRDRGLSQRQAFEAMLLTYNPRCEPPWDAGELATKTANAYRYATGAAGAKVALPADFPVVDVPNLGSIVPKVGLLPLAEFANREQRSAGYVVKGLLQRASYAEVFGAPGAGKTFVALDVGYSVAAGRDWMGRKVHPGPVLYLAYEGTGGMVKRAKALVQRYGAAPAPLYIVGAAFNLREKTGRAELGDVLAALPAKPVLIVIDTFARALMGGDENSAQDVGAFNSAVAALIESTGACVMIVHHSGKDKSKGARGSSALLGALDTEIEVDGGLVTTRKQRDVEIAAPIGFKLVPLLVGMDEDGDELTSCVVEAATAEAQGLERISGNARRAFDVLCEMSPDNKPIDYRDWLARCKDFLPATRANKALYDVKQALVRKGYISQSSDGFIERKMT